MNFIVSSLLVLLFVTQLSAQSISTRDAKKLFFDPKRTEKVSNGIIDAIVEKSSGRFAVHTSKGTQLLFTRNNGVTSFTNVHVAGKTFTNNTLNGPQTPDHTIAMPTGTTIVQNNSIIFVSEIITHVGRVTMTQQFTPTLENDYAFVRITTTFRNQTPISIPIGALMMMDLMIGASDFVPVNVRGMILTHETEYTRDSIPDEWTAKFPPYTEELKARLRGNGTTAPDQFVVGRWQYNGYLGGASWNYTASGLQFGDNAALMQWNDEVIPPNGSRTIITDHGFLPLLQAELSCSVQSLGFNEASETYEPNPFVLSAFVTNTGDIPLQNMTLTLDALPPGISLASGETMSKVVAAPLPVMQQGKIDWRLVASPFTNDTKVDFTIRLNQPAKLADSCFTSTVIPAFKTFSASLDCGDTITLQLNPDHSGYLNNPFQVRATIRNTGSGALDSLYATISLSPHLQLASGSAQQIVMPAPLGPSQTGVVVWDVRALGDTGRYIEQYTISLIGNHRIRAQCSRPIELLPFGKSCVDVGRTTRGKEFWFAFPPNPSGRTDAEPTLLIAARKQTDVSIERPVFGRTSTITVPAGTVTSFLLEENLNNANDGIVQKNGVRVTSSEPIALYFANLRRAHSDATIILPLEAIGKQYVAVGYNWTDAIEHAIICATEDQTKVTITPYSLTRDGHPPGVPYDVMMNRGESYYVHAGFAGKFGGLTGTIISSDKPIAVIGGGSSGHIPYPNPTDYAYLNPHFEQYIPLNLLGTKYITVPFASRLGGDAFKIVATENGTTFTINSGAPIQLTQIGDSYETNLKEASVIASDKPIVVAQFANSAEFDAIDGEFGDGSMVVLSPANRLIQCHWFTTGMGDVVESNVRYTRFDSTFVNVIVPDGGHRAIVLDGVALADTTFHLVPNSGFRCAQLNIKPGVHSLETSDSSGIGAIVYGFGWHDAFTMNSGFGLNSSIISTDTIPSRVKNFEITPNPFNPRTTISFDYVTQGRRDEFAEVAVYDLRGRRVEILFEGKLRDGRQWFVWESKSNPSGLYVCRVTTKEGIYSKTMVLVK